MYTVPTYDREGGTFLICIKFDVRFFAFSQAHDRQVASKVPSRPPILDKFSMNFNEINVWSLVNRLYVEEYKVQFIFRR